MLGNRDFSKPESTEIAGDVRHKLEVACVHTHRHTQTHKSGCLSNRDASTFSMCVSVIHLHIILGPRGVKRPPAFIKHQPRGLHAFHVRVVVSKLGRVGVAKLPACPRFALNSAAVYPPSSCCSSPLLTSSQNPSEVLHHRML